jgi:hypothetical protein
MGVRSLNWPGSLNPRQGYSPAGGYAGLVPGNFRFGDLPRYFLGQEEGQWPKPGRTTRPGYLFTRRLARRSDYAPQIVGKHPPLLNNEWPSARVRKHPLTRYSHSA